MSSKSAKSSLNLRNVHWLTVDSTFIAIINASIDHILYFTFQQKKRELGKNTTE